MFIIKVLTLLIIIFTIKYIIDKKSSPSNIHVARQQKFWNEMNKIPKMLIKRNQTNNKKTKSYIYEYSIYQFNNV